MASERSSRIAKISIVGLFGAFDYVLPGPDKANLSDTVILYGDNGCGKTTLLQLIFHMLSSANDRGHRAAIAKIPFKRFEIEMTNGVTFTAERTADELVGSYILLACAGATTIRCQYDMRREEKLEPKDVWKQYLSIVESLGLLIYFLSDERQIDSDTIPKVQPDPYIIYDQILRQTETEISRGPRRNLSPSTLEQTIAMVNQWISRQAARGANEGDDNVNTIYTEIVRRLAEQESSIDAQPAREVINSKLGALSTRSESFAKYRLVSSLRADQLIDFVNKAPEQALPAIVRVLQPYIDSTKARLDALEEVHRIASVFVTNFAEFYTHKRVEFDVVDGLRVYEQNGRKLDPEQLSSGERQLLRLFCYTLVSRDKPSIFIIDEPELSLNIKWQRKLIRALNALVEGANNQFLFATHSMEILAQHRRSVVQLKPTPYQGTTVLQG